MGEDVETVGKLKVEHNFCFNEDVKSDYVYVCPMRSLFLRDVEGAVPYERGFGRSWE